MANLKSPSITIAFIEKAASAIERGERGIVMLVLRDAAAANGVKTYTIRDVSGVPTDLTATNQQYIKDALKGYTNAPFKVLAYVMPVAGENDAEVYKAMFEYLATAKFHWLAVPTVETDTKTDDVISWVKTQRDNSNMVKAVLPNADSADNEGIINWASTLTKITTTVGGDGATATTKTAYTPEQCTARIAGLLAGTASTISATYAPLADFDDVDRLDKDARDDAVGKGKLIAFWDGEKVKLNRAVTSFVTTNDTKSDSFKKIKLVENMDMIKSDIQATIEDSYIGKYANSYDNKCLLITAINGYFMELVNEGIIESGSTEIDIESQRTYLVKRGKDVVIDGVSYKPADLTDEQVKVANTDSHVFLKSTVVLLDAIEDVTLRIFV